MQHESGYEIHRRQVENCDINSSYRKKRYSELRKDIPMVTERTLSLQLKELEEDGLIIRTVHTSKPPLKVDYELSEFGKTLIPLLYAISEWGKKAAHIHSKVTIEG